MEYVLLELCEKYSINPMEFDKIPDEVKLSMLAKRSLDMEAKHRQMNKKEDGSKNK